MFFFSVIIYFEREIYSLRFTNLQKDTMLEKKYITDLCSYFEFLTMDQQKPENNSHIAVETPPRLKVYKSFL